MLMPRIFGEDLFDDFMDDFFRPAPREFRGEKPAKGCKVPARIPSQRVNVMKTDIKENEEGFELEVDLPGYKKEDVKAELKDGYLTISASKNEENETKDEKGKYIRRERYVGSCQRSFYVGENLDENDIKAKFEDGILKLSVPKKEPKPEVEEKKYIMIE
ncbi:MAG: Hsp20/alpha crystallin family protein [Lachnospiraceae bacterium]|nr:Hsp20/alpha crystallin family protein [Lachnospiraceae bacterium]